MNKHWVLIYLQSLLPIVISQHQYRQNILFCGGVLMWELWAMQPHNASCIPMPPGWFVFSLLQSLHAHLMLFNFDESNLSGRECSSVPRVWHSCGVIRHCHPYYDSCWDAAIQGQSNGCWQSYLHARFGLVCLTAPSHYLCNYLASATSASYWPEAVHMSFSQRTRWVHMFCCRHTWAKWKSTHVSALQLSIFPSASWYLITGWHWTSCEELLQKSWSCNLYFALLDIPNSCALQIGAHEVLPDLVMLLANGYFSYPPWSNLESSVKTLGTFPENGVQSWLSLRCIYCCLQIWKWKCKTIYCRCWISRCTFLYLSKSYPASAL